jgi:hypothetical protein
MLYESLYYYYVYLYITMCPYTTLYGGPHCDMCAHTELVA